MNQVTTTANGKDIMDPTNTYNPFAKAAEDMGANTGLFIRFGGNSGDFTVGEDEIPIGTQFICDAFNAKHGWTCWKDSAPIDKMLIRMIDGPIPAEDTLKDHGPYDESDDSTDGWGKAYAFSLTSPVTGRLYTLEVNAMSSISSLGKFVAEYGKMFRMHPNEMPIIELGSGSYIPKEKKRGRKHFAIFNIVGWIGNDKVEALHGSAAAAAEEEAAEGADNPANYAQESPKVEEAPVEQKAAEQPTAAATGRAKRTF